MKTINYLYAIAACVMMLCSSCSDDDTPLDETAFKATVSGRFYQLVNTQELEKEGDRWVDSYAGIDGRPLGIAGYIWFNNGKVVTQTIYRLHLPYDPGREWTHSPNYTASNLSSTYQYNQETGEITTTTGIPGTETMGDRIFVEQVNEREMTLRIEHADRDHTGARESFVVSTPSEQASAVTFGSSEEVFEYVKTKME